MEASLKKSKLIALLPDQRVKKHDFCVGNLRHEFRRQRTETEKFSASPHFHINNGPIIHPFNYVISQRSLNKPEYICVMFSAKHAFGSAILMIKAGI